MYKVSMIIILSLLTFWPSTAQTAMCATSEALAKYLQTQWHEAMIWEGRIKNTKDLLELWVNPENKLNWSIIRTNPAKKS